MNPTLPGRTVTLRRSTRNKQPPTKPTVHTASPTARKYIARDAHEIFFRPKEKGKRKPAHRQAKPKKKKRKVLTDKERRAWAREHYEQHHGHGADKENDSTLSLSEWPPVILGHHQHQHDHDTTMTPISANDLLRHIEHRSTDHEILRDLSNLF